jgi:peptidoglycan hydrolase-like protein with peptidoglycan-binding domain
LIDEGRTRARRSFLDLFIGSEKPCAVNKVVGGVVMGRLISQGAKGADVRAVQDVLNFHIRRFEPLAVDGDFGPKTHARVVEFQRANGLKPDGVVGPNTLGKLFEEEVVPVGLALVPQTGTGIRQGALGLQPPRLIPPLTLAPVVSPFFLPPASFSLVPTLNQRGQALNFNLTAPVRNDPVDPAVASFNQITRLLSSLPPNFPFRAALIGAVPTPVKKVGPLELDPVSPMSFGFKWGVEPLFDLSSIGPPVQFSVGAGVIARYVLQVINRPGAPVPQLGLFGQGDFKGIIDWTSQKAESRPLLDLKGTFVIGIDVRF